MADLAVSMAAKDEIVPSKDQSFLHSDATKIWCSDRGTSVHSGRLLIARALLVIAFSNNS